jgi:hypothetical protein
MKGLDFEARQATLGNMVYNAQSVARYLLPITKQRMLDEWQKSWVVAETGRFSHSIFPRVSLRPWFEEWRTEWKLITITTLKDYLGALRSSSPPETFQHCWWKHVCVSRGSCRPYNMEVLPFFVSMNMLWRLRRDPDTRFVCPIELESSLRVFWRPKWCSGWECWLLIQRSRVQIPGKSWSFSEG